MKNSVMYKKIGYYKDQKESGKRYPKSIKAWTLMNNFISNHDYTFIYVHKKSFNILILYAV